VTLSWTTPTHLIFGRPIFILPLLLCVGCWSDSFPLICDRRFLCLSHFRRACYILPHLRLIPVTIWLAKWKGLLPMVVSLINCRWFWFFHVTILLYFDIYFLQSSSLWVWYM
jgi:hypothetical protein